VLKVIARTPMAAQEVARSATAWRAARSRARLVVFNEEEVTEEKLEAKIKETLKLLDKVADAHKEYLAYRKKFLEIGKRDRSYVKAKWRWAAAHRVSQAIRDIEFASR
jgi:RNA polymerase primary sigma factor